MSRTSRTRDLLGLVGGVVIAVSSVPHSVMGWPALRAQLAATRAPADLVTGLEIGWKFGGATMLAIGVTMVWLFAGRYRGADHSTVPAFVAGLLYVAFGAWALAVGDMNPFFLIFIIPGALLLIAAMGRRV